MTLWHYTDRNRHARIGANGLLLPPRLTASRTSRMWTLPDWAQLRLDLIWLTDLDYPKREALGLTMHAIANDRTEIRYRVTQPVAKPQPIAWMKFRRHLDPRLVEDLELAPGAMPAHWYVATAPVRVQFDPLPALVH